MRAVFKWVQSFLCQVHLFLRRHRCLRALLLVILVVATAAIWALFFAPDKIRQATLSVEKSAKKVAQFLPASLPQPTRIETAHWLPQNWPERDRYWFHHTPQGTATFPIPFVWFLALERPEISLFRHPGYIRDEAFMRRLGFIPSPDIKTLQSGAPQYGYSNSKAIDPALTTERDRTTGYPDNTFRLPVGFAKAKAGRDPATGEPYPELLGLTCAACHTGHIEYRNVSVRFDGGPAMVNLGELERAIGLSIAYTLIIPTRFGRFAGEIERISGKPVDREDLKQKLEDALEQIRNKKTMEDKILDQQEARHVEEGFGRLDALNRIGNQVFFANVLPRKATKKDASKDLQKVMPDHHLAANFARQDAPVSFPPIWSTPWFSWAQYDASVQNELVRNAGEALGVNAKVNLREYGDAQRPTFRSSVEMLNIFWFERLLAGPHPLEGDKGFKGLLAPKWADAAKLFPNDAAWKLDETLVAEGRALYRKHCVECHRPPVSDPTDKSVWDDEHWVNMGGKRYFNVVHLTVDAIGTDRQQARVLTERRVNLPKALGLRPIAHLNAQGACELPGEEPATTPGETLNTSFVLALMAVVDRTIAQWFDDNPKYRHLEKEMRGPRRNCQNRRVFRTVRRIDSETARPELAIVMHYRARPLDGVWATAPYLHNGSVPTLQDMLTPQHQRPKVFCVGSRQFDPVKVGLAGPIGGPCDAYTRFDADHLGNSNLGHSFEGTVADPKQLPNGVIGPELTQRERNALVEYLKTL
jgi:mono/diheme cytochrome c family protein